jgi:hypothetical protein
MQITNNTLYDKELILKYNRFYLKSYMIKNFIIITIISFAFIIYMLVEAEWGYAALLLGILVAYYVLTLAMQKLTTNKMLKRSPLVENPLLQTYVFTEESFNVTNVNTYTVDYTQVQKVREGRDFFMVQTNDRKTYIVDFKGFESIEERDELAQFFNVKFNLKLR